MKRIMLSLAVLGALLAPATAGAWTGNVFKSPTGNIVCKYRTGLDSIACGRWNDERIVALAFDGSAREGSHMSWADDSPHTLFYGETWRGNGSRITCFSGSNGMRCTNYRGHGFFLSGTVLNAW